MIYIILDLICIQNDTRWAMPVKNMQNKGNKPYSESAVTLDNGQYYSNRPKLPKSKSMFSYFF